MKSLLTVVSLVALAGCVVAPPAPANYGTRVVQAPYDPYQWHVVPPESAPAAPPPSRVEYTSEPAPVVYAPQTVYAPQPVYVQPYYAPYYYSPYAYEPALTFGLGVILGRAWYDGWHGGRGRAFSRGHR